MAHYFSNLFPDTCSICKVWHYKTNCYVFKTDPSLFQDEVDLTPPEATMQEVTESLMKTLTDFEAKVYQMIAAEESTICTTKEVIFEETYQPDESASLQIREREKNEDSKVTTGRASLGTPRLDPYEFSDSVFDDDGEFEYIFEKKDPKKGNCFHYKRRYKF
jgi:hypothetical protein